MGLAWGLFAPLAVGASVLRVFVDRLAGEQNNGLWFKVHLCLNILVLLLTIAGFAVAVVETREDKEEEGEELGKIEGVHPRLGVAILVLVVLQSIAGFFRPALPKPASDEKDKQQPMDGRDETEPSDVPPKPDDEKSSQRMAFEVLHRVSGLALLGMAWYNCHTGISLSMEEIEGYWDWTAVFWGVEALLVGVIVFGKVFLVATSK